MHHDVTSPQAAPHYRYWPLHDLRTNCIPASGLQHRMSRQSILAIQAQPVQHALLLSSHESHPASFALLCPCCLSSCMLCQFLLHCTNPKIGQCMHCTRLSAVDICMDQSKAAKSSRRLAPEGTCPGPVLHVLI